MTSDSAKLKPARQVAFGIGTLSLVALQGVVPEHLPLPSLLNSMRLAPAHAQAVRYTPPKRPGFKRSDGTGTREGPLRLCGKGSIASFTALAPADHPGETISARPNLFWYLSSRQTVELKLMESGVRNPVFVQTVRVDKPGIVSLQLPNTAPELRIEKDYRWSIAVMCEDGTKDALTVAAIRRVVPTPALKQQLAIAKSDRELAQVYAAQGLWYDALLLLSKAVAADPTNRSHRDRLLSLLDQAGFTKITNQERKELRR